MATGVFGLRQVYKKQYQNIKNNNFASWPESATYGYYGGGQYDGGTFWYAIPRLDFATSTTSFPTNYLPDSMRGIAPASSDSYGYFAGGNTPSPATISSSVLRFDYSNEIVSNPGKNLPSALFNAGSVQSSNNAYFGGGQNTPANFQSISNIVRFQFSTETVNVPGNNLPSAREILGGLSSSSYGYFGGGYFKSNTFPYPANIISTIARLDFSNESISLPGKNLPEAIYNVGTVSSISSSYGYFAGGNPAVAGGAYSSTIRRLDFSTENLTDGVAFLPPAGGLGGRAGSGSTKSFDSGYFGGGQYPPANISIGTISKLDFSNTTITDLSSSLPLGVVRPAGLSGGASVYRGAKTFGYFGGVYTPPFINTISRLDFSNETVSNPGKNLPTARRNLASVSNNYYGYFGGGDIPPTSGRISTITRLDFSNETVSDPGNNLPSIRGNLDAFSSSSYGYFGGGFAPPSINTITRLDFSNETVSNPGNNLPTARSGLFAVSNNSYGYFGGGLEPPVINTITRLDFSNETVSDPGNNLPTAVYSSSGTSSNSYGYFGGGQTPTYINTVTRLDFSNETVSDPGKNLPTARAELASVSSSFYGYFGGGEIAITPTNISTISRLDFSNEIVSNPGNLPSARGGLSAVSNSN
jgi:hypothetical protein